MIGCVLVIPYALLFGAIRQIPWWWRLIDCSFGVRGIVPLAICYKLVKKSEKGSSPAI
jgi:NhaP-type Na+/H+ or K+/H+ antiporter